MYAVSDATANKNGRLETAQDMHLFVLYAEMLCIKLYKDHLKLKQVDIIINN
jgi:hypothetical protein